MNFHEQRLQHSAQENVLCDPMALIPMAWGSSPVLDIPTPIHVVRAIEREGGGGSNE